MDSKSIKEALEKAYDLEAELDEAVNARVSEFTRIINEISEQPNGQRKLDFIARLLKDPDLLDSTAAKLGIAA